MQKYILNTKQFKRECNCKLFLYNLQPEFYSYHEVEDCVSLVTPSPTPRTAKTAKTKGIEHSNEIELEYHKFSEAWLVFWS